MILSNDEILKILKESTEQVPKWITDARTLNKELEALVNGIDFGTLLYRVEHKEDDKQLLARKRYSHSVKDMFEKIIFPERSLITNFFILGNCPKGTVMS